MQIFHINYLGVDQPSLQLNFSKNANMVVAQYYQARSLPVAGPCLSTPRLSWLRRRSPCVSVCVKAVGH